MPETPQPSAASNPHALKLEVVLYLLLSAKDPAQFERAKRKARRIAALSEEQVRSLLAGGKLRPERPGSLLRAMRL